MKNDIILFLYVLYSDIISLITLILYYHESKKTAFVTKSPSESSSLWKSLIKKLRLGSSLIVVNCASYYCPTEEFVYKPVLTDSRLISLEQTFLLASLSLVAVLVFC